mmetsp:Transcript_8957/g.17474  ORF Transcript_8957/g.17474 Transcript_8957/m.17474 type:complete len:201 (+) Transcript_8957:392-994(+)
MAKKAASRHKLASSAPVKCSVHASLASAAKSTPLPSSPSPLDKPAAEPAAEPAESAEPPAAESAAGSPRQRRCTARMASRAWASGAGICTEASNLPGRSSAASKLLGRFVAATTSTSSCLLLLSASCCPPVAPPPRMPSISLRKVESTRASTDDDDPPPDAPRSTTSASNSSKKSRAGLHLRARANACRTDASASPTIGL